MAEEKLVAKVVVSEKPDDSVLHMVAEFVKKRGCYKTEYTIDPDIIGGIVIRIGDKVYDGSLRSRLETIRQSL